MRIHYEFLPQGSVIIPRDDRWTCREPDGSQRVFEPGRTVICDVGNLLCPGVIDQHAVEWQGLCTTALVADEPEKFLANVEPDANEVTLVTHYDPDFDGAAALYLVRHYLENGQLPDFAFSLATYAQSVDSGLFQLDPAAPHSPAALTMALGCLFPREDPRAHALAALKEMFRFFEQWPRLLLKSANTFGPDFLKGLDDFQEAQDLVHSDVYHYFADVRERSDFFTLALLNLKTHETEPVDCIVTYSPRSILWKYWARNDHGRSLQGKGFALTCGFFDTFEPLTRAIIAVNPHRPYHLKGLGLLLEKLEMDALRETGVGDPVGDHPRPGFVRENPWYDGRNALHKFTIIDAPSGGSVLSRETIVDALQNSRLWTRLRTDFEKYNTAEKLHQISV